MEKENQGILEMIPPLRGGDFQGIAGLSSDDSLLVGVSTAREPSFKKTPALSNIGSMSPARLSLSTVASPHCRLLFHLAGKSLAEKTTKVVRAAPNQASVITHRGLEVKQQLFASGLGRNIFLTFPFYRTGDDTSVRFSFAFLGVGERRCFANLSVLDEWPQATYDDRCHGTQTKSKAIPRMASG